MDENGQKEAGIGPYFKKCIVYLMDSVTRLGNFF